MSTTSTKDHPDVVSEENQVKNEESSEEASRGPEIIVGSLFLRLTPELWHIVFEWIGPDDMKSCIRLATSGDRNLAHFIYTECPYFWREIDLAKFPRITDAQLESLLERINARTVTRSIVFDKTSAVPITGTALEPLRHSRVLESVDLRQADSRDIGPTGLNDELVTDILSTMLHHNLKMVKVQKQFEPRGSPFDEYSYFWSAFFTNFKLHHAGKCMNELCSHCGSSLVPRLGRLTTEQVLSGHSVQCTVCTQYSCRAWRPDSAWLSCPTIRECGHCLERCCSCRPVVKCDYCEGNSCSECDNMQLTCHRCGRTSCSECEEVKQCKECLETGCEDCGVEVYTCCRCNMGVCEENCSDVFFNFCYECGEGVCRDCSKKTNGEPCFAECHACGYGLCASCSNLEEAFQECPYCGLYACKQDFADDDDCERRFETHVCILPGELVYSARNAREDDDESSLCTCGKKHLESSKGQKFICGWLLQK